MPSPFPRLQHQSKKCPRVPKIGARGRFYVVLLQAEHKHDTKQYTHREEYKKENS